MISIILIASFFILLILGVPVAFAVGVSALGTIMLTNVPVFVIFQRMFGGVDSFTLLAIPFFIFMGNIMDKGGIAKRIVDFANIIIGQIRGGLAAVNILSSMFFAGISGSAVADTSSVGAILIPMMNEEGYDKNFTVAVTCTSSTIGLIIPPSNPMILYSFVAGGISVAQLFAAGLIPGILVGLGLMVVAFIISVKMKYPKHPRPSMKEVVHTVRDAGLSMVVVIVIVGGILGGIFTATEAAVFGVAYSLIITMFVYKELKPKDLPEVMLKTVLTTAIVIFLIATSTAFSYVMAVERVPQAISAFLYQSHRISIFTLDNKRHASFCWDVYGYVSSYSHIYSNYITNGSAFWYESCSLWNNDVSQSLYWAHYSSSRCCTICGFKYWANIYVESN